MPNEIYCMHCMNKVPEGASVCPWCQKNPQDYHAELHHLPPNTILYGKYLIGKVLGEGGFGITYIARDLNLDIKVAVKEYYPYGCVNRNHSYSEDITVSGNVSNDEFETGKRKLMGEARTLAIFSDLKGIVGVRDFFLFNNTAYIVMDYLEGITLKEYLKTRTTIPFDEAVTLLMPIMEDLVKVHETGLVHRDISPDNIMIVKDGTARLMDFGAARQTEGTDTKSLSIVLKPGYTPEEQYRSRGEQGPWTDVYALCATIYKAVTGILPDEALQRLVEDTVKAPSALGVSIPKEKEQALMKGLAVFRKDRYQDMAELINGLKNGEKTEQTLLSKAVSGIASGGNAIKQDNNKKKQMAGIAAAVVICIILAFAMRQRAKKAEMERAAAEIMDEFEAELAEINGEKGSEEAAAEAPTEEPAAEVVDGGTAAGPETAQEEEESTPPPAQRTNAAAENVPDKIGDSLEDYEIMIDGVYYKFPMSYQEFKEKGWEMESMNRDEDDNIESGDIDGATMSLDGSTASVSFYNPDNKTQALKDCYVSGLTIKDKLVSDFVVLLPKGLMFGKATREDIVSAYGDLATAYEGSPYITLTYYFEKGRWEFYVDNETGTLFRVDMTHNSSPEGFVGSAVNADMTEEERQYKAPQELGDDIMSDIVEFDGDLYRLPCPLNAMLQNGWNISPNVDVDHLASGDGGTLELIRNGKKKTVSIRNLDTEAHYLGNCFVTFIADGEGTLVLPEGIKAGMASGEFLEVLEQSGYTYNQREGDSLDFYDVYHDKDTSSQDRLHISVSKEGKDAGKIFVVEYSRSEFPD